MLEMGGVTNLIECDMHFYNLQHLRQIQNQMFGRPESSHKREENAEDYKKIQSYLFRAADKIGEGKFSKVYKGIHKQTRQLVAIKVIQNSTIKSKTASELLKNEVSIIKELNHPNIMKCLDVLASQNHCYIVMQFYEGGDLQKLLAKRRRFEEHEISKIIYEVYKGLSYLNSQNIIHRDFKIANVFLTAQGNIKIGDFGFAVKAYDQFKDIDIGSKIYMSPEGMLSKQYGPKTQVWAFAIMIYELLHGEAPLSDCKTENELRQKIIMPVKYRSGLSAQLKDMLNKCLQIYPKNRISMRDIANTAYMSRIIHENEFYMIPKQMASTHYTSNSSGCYGLNLIRDIKNYDDALAILQYCRLIHKTCEKIPSYILSQWLLNISWQLRKSRPQGSAQKIQKFITTVQDYYSKYQKEHKESNLFVSADQVKRECERLHNVAIQTSFSNTITKSIVSFLTMLKNETEMLSNSLELGRIHEYAAVSQTQRFLQNYKLSLSQGAKKTGFGFYGVKH